jgi:hypothetical protein
MTFQGANIREEMVEVKKGRVYYLDKVLGVFIF